MLNPRDFLEDCIRNGLNSLWTSGMPWPLVHEAIDTDFNYNVSDDTKARWVAQTGRSWENTDDPLIKELKCPACRASLSVPWTTCGLDENDKTSSCVPDP